MGRAHARAGIFAVGDELALGQSLDTNSRWLADRLTGLGVVPIEHVTVPDDAGAIAGAIERLTRVADVVIGTGGLGPTADDLTREALARVLGTGLAEDAGAWRAIEARAAGRAITPSVRVQALVPTGASWIPNGAGVAPGLWAEAAGGVLVVCLPGPPTEMRAMFDAHVAAMLRPPTGRVVMTRTLRTFGIGESALAERLGDLLARQSSPLVGTAASAGHVTCRLRFEGPGSSEGASAALDGVERDIRGRLGPLVYGTGDETLAGVVLGRLCERGETLATIESCTGGLVGAMLTETPGSSAAYVGGWVTYTDALKRSAAGVPIETLRAHGAVSAEAAVSMARGALERADSTHALAITGIAGPGGGSEAKPVGTVWIARASADGSMDARGFRFAGDRELVRHWSAWTGLGMVWLALCGGETTRLHRQFAPEM